MGRGKPQKKPPKTADSHESTKGARGHQGSRKGGRGRGYRGRKSLEEDGEEHGKPHRLLESNWSRYDEPEELEDNQADEYDETKDFEYVKQNVGGASSHFQFKEEKELQDELTTTDSSQTGTNILDLDLEQLGAHVSTLDLVEMLSLHELVGDLDKDIGNHFHDLMFGEDVVSHDTLNDSKGKTNFNEHTDDEDEKVPSWNYKGIERYKKSLLVDQLSTHINIRLKSYEKTPALSSDKNTSDEESSGEVSPTHCREDGAGHTSKCAREVILNDSTSGESVHTIAGDIHRTSNGLAIQTTREHSKADLKDNLANSNVTDPPPISTKSIPIDLDVSLQDLSENKTTQEDTDVLLDELLNDTCQLNFHNACEGAPSNEEVFDLDDLLAAVPSGSSAHKNWNSECEDDLNELLDNMLE